ncbi:N-acetylglucosamine-6-phosphate deacetylase [Propionibacteriaceae bacterium Y1685]
MPTTTLLTGASALIDATIVSDRMIMVQQDRITAVGTADDPMINNALTTGSADIIDLGGALVSPGLVDLHVHGAAGAAFEKADTAGVALAHLASCGVTSVMASLASAPMESMLNTSTALDARTKGDAEARLIGVHLEGPFIAVDQCGAHDPQFLISPTADDVARIADLAEVVRQITIAPELIGAVEATRRWSEADILVAAGHSSATAEHLHPCIDAGLRHATHLWSGMGTFFRRGPYRVPGLVEECLASDVLTAEVIADGRHLPPALLEIARRAVGERLIMVSDGTIGTGLPEGTRYQLSTVEAVVDDGVGKIVGQDAFAGSTTDLAQMVRHLHQNVGWPLAEVLDMATRRPADIVGRDDLGRLSPGALADLIILDAQQQVTGTMINGQWIGPAPTAVPTTTRENS